MGSAFSAAIEIQPYNQENSPSHQPATSQPATSICFLSSTLQPSIKSRAQAAFEYSVVGSSKPVNSMTTTPTIYADPFADAIIIETASSGRTTVPLDTLGQDPRKQNKRFLKRFGLGDECSSLVESALKELQSRRWLNGNVGSSAHGANGAPPLTPSGIPTDMDQCLDLLYGSDNDKQTAASFLASLCHQTETNVAHIAENSLMSALARLLREDCPESMDLLFSVSKIFLAISTSTEMHHVLASHRIGSLVMDALILECKRARASNSNGSSSSSSSADADIDARNDLSTGITISTSNSGTSVSTSSSSLTRPCCFTSKQENTVSICLTILDNLADDVYVLRKMMKTGMMMEPLLSCLSCRSTDCVQRALVLLRKACFFAEVVTDLARKETRGIDAIICHAKAEDREVVDNALRVLFNTSFHQECRKLMLEQNLVHALATIAAKNAKDAPLRLVSLRLLYHLSADECSRYRFADGDCLSIVSKLVQQATRNDSLPKELAALVINISTNPLCAEQLIGRLGGFIAARIGDTNDSLLLLAAIMRNLSLWTLNLQYKIDQAMAKGSDECLRGMVKDPSKYVNLESSPGIDNEKGPVFTSLYCQHDFWGSHLPKLLAACVDCTEDSLMVTVELLGTVGNMTVHDLPSESDWISLLSDFPLLPLLTKVLASQEFEQSTEAKLETMAVCETLAADEKAAALLADNKIPALIATILLEQGSNGNEIVFRALCTLRQMLFHDECRTMVMSEQIIERISRCLVSHCLQIRHCAERCLDAIVGLAVVDQNDEDGQQYSELARDTRFAHYLSIR